MVRAKREMSSSAAGKPTERTMAPQAPVRTRHSVMDGIVKGIAKGTHTAVVDGVLKGAPMSGALESPTMRSMVKGIPVAGPATKMAPQQYGSIPYAMSRGGGM